MFGRGLIGVAGSLALAAQLIYFAAITVLPYWIGCGLPHDQKIVLSCGMATRNLGVALVSRGRPTGNRDGGPGPTYYGRIRAGRWLAAPPHG